MGCIGGGHLRAKGRRIGGRSRRRWTAHGGVYTGNRRCSSGMLAARRVEAIGATAFVPGEIVVQLCDALGLIGTARALRPEDYGDGRRRMSITPASDLQVFLEEGDRARPRLFGR